MNNTLNLEVDGLESGSTPVCADESGFLLRYSGGWVRTWYQKQKRTSGSNPVIQENESETAVGKGSLGYWQHQYVANKSAEMM